MGVYASRDLEGQPLPARGKADALMATGAHLILGDPPRWNDQFINRLICVVENYGFDAAAIVTDRDEFDRFRNGMAGRNHFWIMVPNAQELK